MPNPNTFCIWISHELNMLNPMWTLSRASIPSPAAADLSWSYLCGYERVSFLRGDVLWFNPECNISNYIYIIIARVTLFGWNGSIHSSPLYYSQDVSIKFQDCKTRHTTQHQLMESLNFPGRQRSHALNTFPAAEVILLEIDIKWDHIKQYLLQATAARSCGNMPTYANKALLLSKITGVWERNKMASCSPSRPDLYTRLPAAPRICLLQNLDAKTFHMVKSQLIGLIWQTNTTINMLFLFHFTVPNHLLKQSLRSCNLQVPQPSKFIRLTQGDVRGSKQRWPQMQPWLATGHMEFAGLISTLEIKNIHEHP